MSATGSPDNPPRQSSGMKIGLIIAVCLAVVCSGVLLVGGVAVTAVSSMRSAARRIQAENNLHQIGIALHLYETDNGEFPPAVVYDGKGRPLYSWRLLILPYLEEGQVAAEFHYDEPWDSPHNQALLPRCPKVFRHPLATNNDPSLTYFRVFDGPGAAFESDPRLGFRPFEAGGKQVQRSKPNISLRDFPDGLPNTFLVVEAADPVPWTKPDELPFAPGQPLPRLGGLDGKSILALFGDAHSEHLALNTPENILRAYITRNGNDPVPGK